MAEVILHVYDMTKRGNGHEALNFSVVQMNKLLKDGVHLGGFFHTAVQIYGNEEWAYGHRDKGTGVFSCPAGKNPSYTLRETIVMGRTECSPSKVSKMLQELSDSWPGDKYHVVSRNSNQFSNELLERLGVPKLPGWVNRFTNIADAAKEATGTLLKGKDEALKRVFHPIDYALGSSSGANTTSAPKAVKAAPVKLNFHLKFFDNFKVSAPKMRHDDDCHHHHHNQGAVIDPPPPVIHVIDEGDEPAETLLIHSNDDQPPAVTHKDDEKPACFHA